MWRLHSSFSEDAAQHNIHQTYVKKDYLKKKKRNNKSRLGPMLMESRQFGQKVSNFFGGVISLKDSE